MALDVLHERCAGLDVHKQTVVACVRIARGKRATREVRTFGTTTGELLEMGDWLKIEGVTHVLMESTGIYWRPVWHALEGEFELVLANAVEVKNVPGRKTDVKDAEWLADLLAHGLARSSFVPPPAIQSLRDLTRTRRQFVRERTSHIQRIQKVLEDANVKVDSVISNIMGQSGRAFVEAIISGEDRPAELAKLASRRLHASPEALQAALQGMTTNHHRFMLKLHLGAVDAADVCIAKIESEVTALLAPFHESVALLLTMPGISTTMAEIVVAETGADMGRFATAGHLVAWAGLCPRNDESAGKRRSTHLRPGADWLRTALVQCAWAAIRKKDGRFEGLFYRLRSRAGAKKAIIAVAAEMLRCAWHMLSRRQPFKDLNPADQDPDRKERAAKRLLKKIQSLGFQATLRPIVAPT